MLGKPRHRGHVVLAASVIALVAAVVAAAALLGSGGRSSASVPAPRPPATSRPAVIPLADSAAVPTTQGMTAALAAAVADPNLGNLTGEISDARTGTQIWEQRADVPMQPASTNKILTTAAALLTLDRDARSLLQVKVREGDEADDIFVKLMGDVVEPRREFIQDNALSVANLDV